MSDKQRIFAIMFRRTIALDVLQGILIGFGLAFITLPFLGNAYATKVNRWTTNAPLRYEEIALHQSGTGFR